MKRKQVSECGVCRGTTEERLLLHNVRHRGHYRRLCTTCVLNNFPGLFCPICFEVFEELPPLQQRVMCFKCPSITHTACVPLEELPPPPPPPPPYQCVSCRNPNFAFFGSSSSSNRNNRIKEVADDGESIAEIRRELHTDSAKKLLAAAKIACVLMSKAADAARADAERKVNEAALAKRKAREAMEHVIFTQNPKNPTQNNNSIKPDPTRAQDQVDKSQPPKIGISNVQRNKYSNGSSPVSPPFVGKLQHHQQSTRHGN